MDPEHTCPVPQSKQREVRNNHIAHLSGYYIHLLNCLNAALDPTTVNGDKYYLDVVDQKSLVKEAKDAAKDLKDQAQEVFSYLGELLEDHYDE